MQLNRVSAPNEGAAGIDVTDAANANSGAAQGRAAITMVRTHDVKVWRGVPDKMRLRIAPPPGKKVLAESIKGGWLGRVRHMMQARIERVQEQSAQRQAALGLEQSPAEQAGPKWLRSLGSFRGRLQSFIVKLRQRAMPQAAEQLVKTDPVMQTVKTAAAAAVNSAACSAAKDGVVYSTIKTAAPESNANADSAALAQVTAAVQQRFAAQAANKEGFTELLKQAFGDKFDANKAETIRQQALAGDFSWAPKVQVVDSKTLADTSGTQAAGAAKGAYVQDSDTIYISRELLHSDPQEAQRLLMEEIGHGIDARINTSDTVGDEGEIFSKLMHGDKVSGQELAALKADNDSGVVNINGRNVTVEYGWFKKAFKAITGGIKKVVSSVVKGAVNLAKSAVKVATGLVTFNFDKVKEGFKEGVNAVKTTVKTVTQAIKDTAKELHKITKEAFVKLMQSKIFAIVLTIARFIPIPVVQLVVRVIDVVRSAYMVYQGIKNKSLSMVLGGIASLASGGAKLAGSFGASAATINTINSVASAASKLSMAYNVVAKRDIGSALGLLGGMSGVQGTALGAAAGYAQQALGVRDAVRSKDALGALSGVLGMAGTYTGKDSAMGQQLAYAKEAVTGARVIREIDRGNLDAAHSLAASMNSAEKAGLQADAISAQRRADEAKATQAQAAQQGANNRSLLNEADKDLRALPAEQEGAAAAANDGPAKAAADEHRNGSDVDSDNTAGRNGGVGPGSSQTLLTVGKGKDGYLENIARAQYGENWKAGMAQLLRDNADKIKFNQWNSPILREGQTLIANDINGKSEQELAALNRVGGRVISNNDKGLAAKADLEERARQAVAQKAQEAVVFSSNSVHGAEACTPSNPRGLSADQLQAEAAMYARLGLRPPATGPVGSPEWIKTASEAELHRNGYQTVKAWDPALDRAAEAQRLRFQTNIGLAAAGPVLTGWATGARLAGAPDSVVNDIAIAQTGLVMSLATPVSALGSVVARPTAPGYNFNLSSTQSSMDGVASLRHALDVKPARNIAIAQYEINGVTGEMLAVSGQASRVGTASTVAQPRFDYIRTGNNPRTSDSEAKIFENLAATLPRDAIGTLRLFSERPLCVSCGAIVPQFQKEFPGIKVIVNHGPGN